ncbi:MAG: NADH-quinone oxidoreductase subunit J [Chloroflexi bacterium]|nr:NADH-quinone oxidoreductase subunit J [Chloroflexota bacterium]
MPDLASLPYEQTIFYLVSLLAIGAALAMVWSKNAVHAALFMVANFLLVAVLFLLLRAAFLSMIQIVVYAGAIMVLFLFVIMMLNAEKAERPQDVLFGVTSAAPLFAIGLLALLGYVVSTVAQPALGPDGLAFAGIQTIGAELFTKYAYPFEITSVLLLVAMIGAVVLAKRK